MDSALSPREIQTRIRGGESLDAVAEAAGVPAAQIEPFAAPVLAERAHVAGSAKAASVRRLGEPASAHRTLGAVVDRALEERGAHPETAEWDAWQLERRKWIVEVRFTVAQAAQAARFRYDQLGRFSLPHDDEARRLIGEREPAPAAEPGDPNAEPTLDYADEFALLRAVGLEQQPDGPADETIDVVEVRHERIERTGDDVELPDAALTEVDGVYDIVPDGGGLDMIYGLLGGYAEEGPAYEFGDLPAPGATEAARENDGEGANAEADIPRQTEPAETDEHWAKLSRRQRRRLRQQQEEDAAGSAAADDSPTGAKQRGADEQAAAPAGDSPAAGTATSDAATPAAPQDAPQVEPEAAEATVLPSIAARSGGRDGLFRAKADEQIRARTEAVQVAADEPAETSTAGGFASRPDTPRTPEQTPGESARPRPAGEEAQPDTEPAGPTQEALLDEPARKPTAKKAPAKKKRASVPSWDEIMFGGPKPPKK